jgi:uncharacterized membrane protein YGL010W
VVTVTWRTAATVRYYKVDGYKRVALVVAFMRFADLLWSSLQAIREQHAIDLVVYRNGHQDCTNRMLHWILIPIETATSLMLIDRLIVWLTTRLKFGVTATSKRSDRVVDLTVDRVFESAVIRAVNVTLAILSMAASPETFSGCVAAIFHASLAVTYRTKQPVSLQFIGTIWLISWMLQIVLGHWLLEGNNPTFWRSPNAALSGLEQHGVSILAVATSVLIAWKS